MSPSEIDDVKKNVLQKFVKSGLENIPDKFLAFFTFPVISKINPSFHNGVSFIASFSGT